MSFWLNRRIKIEREIEKAIAILEINAFKYKVSCKTKRKLSLGPKMPYFGTFTTEFFKKTIVIFEISTVEFVKMQSFMLKEKSSDLEPTMTVNFQRLKSKF